MKNGNFCANNKETFVVGVELSVWSDNLTFPINLSSMLNLWQPILICLIDFGLLYFALEVVVGNFPSMCMSCLCYFMIFRSSKLSYKNLNFFPCDRDLILPTNVTMLLFHRTSIMGIQATMLSILRTWALMIRSP